MTRIAYSFAALLAASTVVHALSTPDLSAAPASGLHVFVQHGLTVRPAVPGDTISHGDRLQLSYSSAEPTYLTVLQEDAQPCRVVYPRDSAANPVQVRAGSHVPLTMGPLSAEISGPQRFYALFCDKPLSAAQLGYLMNDNARFTQRVAPPGCRLDSAGLTVR